MRDVITIDGPAGSGKSTVARLLAKRLNRLYLDTGAMYRAVALAAKRQGILPTEGERLGEVCRSIDLRFDTDGDPPRLLLDDEDISDAIRVPEMDMLSSTVSAHREVREAITLLQREMAQGRRLVAEGRDMGTVVFHDAKYKFFLTASPEARAARRFQERVNRGERLSRSFVEAEMRKRDHQDETRLLAPLKPAKDAKVIDSTNYTPEEVFEEILEDIKKKETS